MKAKVIPTIFSKNKKDFMDKFYSLVYITDQFQIDLMDGFFVPARSVRLIDIPDLKPYRKNFEAHLMVNNPINYIPKLKKKGFKKVLIHFESTNAEKAIKNANMEGMKAFLVLNPNTSLTRAIKLIQKSDGLMFMGVYPGEENQKFISKTLSKIKKARELFPKLPIEVDGGVSDKNIKKIKDAGANLFSSGSFISGALNPKSALKKLNSLIKG